MLVWLHNDKYFMHFNNRTVSLMSTVGTVLHVNKYRYTGNLAI